LKIFDDGNELFLLNEFAFIKHLFDQRNIDLAILRVYLFGSDTVGKLRIEKFGLMHLWMNVLYNG
jgi:hypothetical protein